MQSQHENPVVSMSQSSENDRTSNSINNANIQLVVNSGTGPAYNIVNSGTGPAYNIVNSGKNHNIYRREGQCKLGVVSTFLTS